LYYYYMDSLIESSLKKNGDLKSRNTLYYSYWQAHAAFALSELKEEKEVDRFISRAHGYDAFFDRRYQPFRKDILRNCQEIHYVSEEAIEVTKNIFALTEQETQSKLKLSPLGVRNEREIAP